MTLTPCFGRRWYHRNLRRMDLAVMLPAIRNRAELGASEPKYTQPWLREINDKTMDAFALFKQMPGQEHWRCACAADET